MAATVRTRCPFCRNSYDDDGDHRCPFCRSSTPMEPEPKAEVPMVTYWEGRPVAELSHEELIVAFNSLGRMYEELVQHNLDNIGRGIEKMKSRLLTLRR